MPWGACLVMCPRPVCVRCKRINVPAALASQLAGSREVYDVIWLVSFALDSLGDVDLKPKARQPGVGPPGTR